MLGVVKKKLVCIKIKLIPSSNKLIHSNKLYLKN